MATNLKMKNALSSYSTERKIQIRNLKYAETRGKGRSIDTNNMESVISAESASTSIEFLVTTLSNALQIKSNQVFF